MFVFARFALQHDFVKLEKKKKQNLQDNENTLN